MGDTTATRTLHLLAELHKDADGDYYVVVQQNTIKPTVIRQAYLAIGGRLTFPKKWGRKHGAIELLNQRIADQQMVIARASAELAALNKCLSVTQNWKDE